MRKASYTIKVDMEVLAKAKHKAKKQNRSFNNFVETAIIEAIDEINEHSPEHIESARSITDGNRT